MASSNQVTQNGNTTQNWTLTTGENNDVVVLQLDNTPGTTGVLISNIVLRINPGRYSFDVSVIGPDAVAFRANWTSIS